MSSFTEHLPQIFDRRFLAIYLNDHLAGATGGLELARRARDSNRGTELGETLIRIADEIESDRERLREIMRFCECREDGVKQAVAWTGEKAGRLKLNGSFTSYSPLSKLIELEGLYLGITGKLSLWQNLERAMGEHLARFDLEELIERAVEQRATVEHHRLEVAAEALAEG